MYTKELFFYRIKFLLIDYDDQIFYSDKNS